MAPRYSIICPAYNVEDYIDETIGSVLAQTEKSWELIIVDDGSVDGTVDRVKSYSDKRIQLICQTNHGQSAARNRGVEASDGELIIFLDSDDMLHPTALARLGGVLSEGEAIASYGQCRFISARGQVLGNLYRRRRNYPPSGDLLRALMVRNVFVNGGHVCVRGSVVRSMKGFRSDLSPLEDYEFWCRLACRGSIIYIDGDTPVLEYRIRAGSEYRLGGRDPDIHAQVLEAIYSIRELPIQYSPEELGRLRRCAEANANWAIALEFIRHDDWAQARWFLRKSVMKRFHAKRAAMLLFALFGGLPRFVTRHIALLRPYDFAAGSGPSNLATQHAAGPIDES